MPDYVACSYEGGAMRLILTYTVVGTFREDGETVEDIRITGSRLEFAKARPQARAFVDGQEIQKDRPNLHAALQHPEIRLYG